MEMQAGHWGGVVTWGPNQFEAAISETSIDSYRLYVVNDRLQKLGPPRAFVEAKLWANLFNPTSCDVRYYEARVNLALPDAAAYFMVVPFTRDGLEMNIGPTSERIVDLMQVATTSGVALCLNRVSSLIIWISLLPFWIAGYTIPL